MKTRTLPDWRTKKSRSSFELFLYALLCLGVAACGSDDSIGVDENETENEVIDPCQVTSPISMGQSIGGQLNANDCVQPDGAYSDRWSLSLSGQTDVRIDLTTSAFDAVLELQDILGNVIAQNDDVGASLNSRIIQTLQARSYIILARSLGSGRTGSYRLSVSEAPDCSPVGVLQLGQTVTGALAADDCLFEFGGVR